MGVIKVETFNQDVANNSVISLTNDVGNLGSAFIRRPGPSDKATGGPTTSTANAAPNIVHAGLDFTSTGAITVRAANTTNRKVIGEVWRYTGPVGGVDEFICRGHLAVTVTGQSTIVNLSGVNNKDKVIPFITGVNTAATSVNDYETCTFAAHIDDLGRLIVSRNNSGTSATVYVDVVEFTGANWSIGHGVSSNHDASDETITLNINSTGVGGATFSASPTNSIIEINMEGDTSETGLSDVLATADFITNSTIQFRQEGDGDANAANDGDGYIHIFSNVGLSVFRDNIVSISETNGGAEATVNFPAGSPVNRQLDELSLEWMVDTTGVGTAHARGRLNARITSAAGTIEHWVHRSGNDVDVRYGVIDLTNVLGVTAPIIQSYSIPSIPLTGASNTIVSGINFQAIQGTGKVELSDSNVYGNGVVVEQSIDTWADTAIQFDIVTAGLAADQFLYLWITDNDGNTGAGFQIYFGNPSYELVLDNDLSDIADHAWGFDGEYTERIQSLPIGANIGSPGFGGPALTRGRTQSMTIDISTERVESNDSNFINLQTEVTRMMGGWIRFDRVQKEFVCLYEEGGGVNNVAFFMGMGGILIAQLADTGDDNVHAFSDFKLQPNRTYHIWWGFDYTAPTREFRLWIDGVKQSGTFGNPLISAGGHLDAHSGDIGWGGAEGTLEVFGTDIVFPGAVTCYYQDWLTFTSTLSDLELREKVFELGVLGEIIITTDTQANMQLQLDAFANSNLINSPCDIIVQACLDGDFTLIPNGIIHNNSSSINIQYIGADTLTWINSNGSNASLTSTPYVGVVNIVETIITTIVGIPAGVEYHLYEKSTVPGLIGTVELLSIENKIDNADVLYSDNYSGDTEVVLQIIEGGLEERLIEFTLQNEPQTIIVSLINETNI